MSMRVGFIGLGDQGAPMARAIAEAGWPLTVWARRTASLTALEGVAHDVVATVAELGANCDLIGICVGNDRDVSEVLLDKGLLDAMRPQRVVVIHSTIAPVSCQRFASEGARRGVLLLDAPVSGGGEGARRRTLTVMLGGDPDVAKRCRPVFSSFAAAMPLLGPVGSGQLAKLLNNTLLAANLKNAADMLVLARDLGFDIEAFVDVVMASSGSSFAVDALGRRVAPDLVEHYQEMMRKDLMHFSDAVRAQGIPYSRLEESAQTGLGDMVAAVRARAASR